MLLLLIIQFVIVIRAEDLKYNFNKSQADDNNQISDLEQYKPHLPSIINGSKKKLSESLKIINFKSIFTNKAYPPVSDPTDGLL